MRYWLSVSEILCRTEVINDSDRFLGLLKTLKNGDLSKEEEELVDEILRS